MVGLPKHNKDVFSKNRMLWQVVSVFVGEYISIGHGVMMHQRIMPWDLFC